ncbi:MAG: glycosyltransferase family 4 protein [Candidatus Paceibacteria bacterium]
MSYNIALIHNKIMEYRKPLFEALSQNYDVEILIFDHQNTDLEVRRQNIDADIEYVGKIEIIKKILYNGYDLIILPDIIFKEAWISLLLCEVAGIPTIQWSEVRKGFDNFVVDKMIELYLSKPNTFIVPGNQQANLLKSKGVNSNSIIFAPNAPVLDCKNAPSLSDELETCLFVGSLTERKGVGDIIRAADIANGSVDNLQTIIIGDSNDERYKNKLNQLLKEADADIILKNWVDDEELLNYYRMADLFVLPSKHDPYPLVVMEALCTGTPVIISNQVGQAGDIVQNGYNGYIVSPEAPSEIANHIIQMTANKDLNYRLSENARNSFENHGTMDKMVESFNQAIEKTMKNQSSRI